MSLGYFNRPNYLLVFEICVSLYQIGILFYIKSSHLPIVRIGIHEAIITKYAYNAFLFVKVSIVNGLGNICNEFGFNPYDVAAVFGYSQYRK